MSDDALLPRLYTEFAPYWRLMSKPEEYVEEAAIWKEAIRSRLGPGRHRIMELGVGGGHNMSHLTADFDFVAVDIAPAMIEQARNLNPEVEFHVGDMRTIRLGRTFDCVLIHDAICHMVSEDDLRAVFETAHVHLRGNGIVITSPDYFAETFRDPQIECRSNTDGETEFTYFEYTFDPDPSDTCIETLMWYLIRQGGRMPRIEQDRLICGLFPLATWGRLMFESHFRVEKDAYNVQGHDGYLLVGVRQS